MTEDVSSTKNLISALASYDDLIRVQARKALVAIGRGAVPYLAEAIQDKKGADLLRWEAAKALVEIGDPRAVPAFVRALEDEEFDVRWLAARGLSELNVKGLGVLFQALIERGDSFFLREGAHHILHDLNKGELRKYLTPVLVALDGVEPAVQVQGAALRALEGLKEAKIV